MIYFLRERNHHTFLPHEKKRGWNVPLIPLQNYAKSGDNKAVQNQRNDIVGDICCRSALRLYYWYNISCLICVDLCAPGQLTKHLYGTCDNDESCTEYILLIGVV
jgi:hypothetical protein